MVAMRSLFWCLGACASSNGTAQVEDQADVQVAEGYTMTQFCDKMIDVFMSDKTQTKELRKLLIFREEWKKYRDKFYHRCQARLDGEGDPLTKQKFIKLKTRIKKVKSFPTAAPVFICYYIKPTEIIHIVKHQIKSVCVCIHVQLSNLHHCITFY